jgi:hypothetical protein
MLACTQEVSWISCSWFLELANLSLQGPSTGQRVQGKTPWRHAGGFQGGASMAGYRTFGRIFPLPSASPGPSNIPHLSCRSEFLLAFLSRYSHSLFASCRAFAVSSPVRHPPAPPANPPHLIGPRITAWSQPAPPDQRCCAGAMCLVKVRQEEDVVVPYRVVNRNHSPRRHSHHSVRRVSRTDIVRESPRPSASYISVPAPQPMPIPAPQPVPVFVEPPPPPPPAPVAPPSMHFDHHRRAHYVEVSPSRSSISSSPTRSEYIIRERETRRERERRDYSPERSPRYETFRYVDGPEEDYDRYERRRSRSRVRQRSPGRVEYHDRGSDYGRGGSPYGERITRERITINEGHGGRRRSEYRR